MSVEEYDDLPEDVLMEEDTVDEMDTVDGLMNAAENQKAEPIDKNELVMLNYLTSSPSLWVKALSILKPEYFKSENKSTVDFVMEYYNKHGNLPSHMVIEAETGIKLEVPPDVSEDHALDHAASSIETFCSNKAVEIFVYSAADELSAYDMRAPREVFEELSKKMRDVTNISLTRNLGYEVHTDSAELLKQALEYTGISTGIKLLDDALDGGVTMPSLNIVSAASGDGKSIWLQNMAVNYAEQGHNVVFYTLELEESIVEHRFAAMITGTHIKMVLGNIFTVNKQMQQIGKQRGMIQLIKFPMAGTTMADIASHHRELKLKTGKDWNRVCIDYIDIMTPIERIDKTNIHLKDKFVSEEMNDWLHREMLIGWSASQQTKGAQDEKEARQSGLSGGTPKVNTADNVIVLKRSDEDRIDKRLWAHIVKARSAGGTGVKVPLDWDQPGTLRLSSGDEDLYKKANPALFGKSDSGASDNGSVTKDELYKDERTKSGQRDLADNVISRLNRGKPK